MANATQQQSNFTNKILHGDCIDAMRQMPAASVDFILTDPPYLVNYRDRLGRSIDNDANGDWLKPAMADAYRLLKPNRVAVMFYGWTRTDAFFEAWREAGFIPSAISYSGRPTAQRADSSDTATSRLICWRKTGRHCRSIRRPM
jgi:tRNA1(Val) A37 N6-methylase TrmN6